MTTWMTASASAAILLTMAVMVVRRLVAGLAMPLPTTSVHHWIDTTVLWKRWGLQRRVLESCLCCRLRRCLGTVQCRAGQRRLRHCRILRSPLTRWWVVTATSSD